MKKQYVVRVVIMASDVNFPPLKGLIDDIFLESLRYAGIISLHTNDEEKQTFDIHCPKTVSNSKMWSEQNAARMTSFGYNAVSAPAWG